MIPIKEPPYRPITPDLAASGTLVSIKEAAAAEGACESTLKANAKARRLPAYQSGFGAPVMVIPAEVVDFLKSRSDIASRWNPKSSPAASSARLSAAVPKTQRCSDFPFPDEEDFSGSIDDCGVHIKLNALNHAHPSEIALVAACFSEVGRQLNQLTASHTN